MFGRSRMVGNSAVDTTEETIATLRSDVARMHAALEQSEENFAAMSNNASVAEGLYTEAASLQKEVQHQLAISENLRNEAGIAFRIDMERLCDTIAKMTARNKETEDALAAAISEKGSLAKPRKTITDRERKVLVAVIKSIDGRPEGTADAPQRIALKVSTVRTLANALGRVIRD